jgi:hypothetical protein
MQPAHSRRRRCPMSPRMPSSLADRPRPVCAAPQHRDQPIDRDHQHALLDPLDAARANQAHDRHRAASTPPPTPPRQPRRLLAHPSEMPIVVRPRFRLDHEPDAGRRDGQRIDVASALPRQQVAQPPALRLKRRKRAPRLVLRASTHTAALGRATSSGGRRGRNRARARAGPPRQTRLPRSRQPAPAARRRRSPSPPERPAKAGGTAGGARSSSKTVADAMFLLPAQSSRAMFPPPQDAPTIPPRRPLTDPID